MPAKLRNFRDLSAERERIVKARAAFPYTITISSGTCGLAKGSAELVKAMNAAVRDLRLGKKVLVKTTGCHGFCDIEPVVHVGPRGILYQKVAPADAREILAETVLKNNVLDRLLYADPRTGHKIRYAQDIPFYKSQHRLLTKANALVDPESLDDYLAIGGYGAMAKALLELDPERVIAEVKTSRLRGRGGAGFPTGFKWEFCRRAKGDARYVICNADEGDPGAYMDRSLLEGNPHAVLEGMAIGAFAIGAREGWVYVRHEYPLAVRNVRKAVADARARGLLGRNILGSGFDFDVRIERGAGAFVCGEETALISSVQGQRGEPRQRPPFPAVKGLWGKPTNINNVETWANVPIIIAEGGDWFARIGTEGSGGTKIFSLVGKCAHTGLVEVPIGTTLREIIYNIGDGIKGGGKFKAVQTGGPSGGCIPGSLLDLTVDYESLAKAGAIMGSGGMIVMDDSTCMVDVAKYFLRFLKDESCGKCLSCREGTQRLYEIVERICDGRGVEEDLELLEELAQVVKDASLCGLGQTAPNPVLSTLRYFRNEYKRHIIDKKCDAFVCSNLVGAPCQSACPLGTEAWRYIALLEKRKFGEAYEAIRETNPFPSVCARICDRRCEDKCRLGTTGGEPIAVRDLKRVVTDRVSPAGVKPQKPLVCPDMPKVAVVGAGPAGLVAAHDLSMEGYRVTVFEAEKEPGGMLLSVIPAYRLPHDILRKEIKALLNENITLRCGTALGRDVTVDGLFQDGFKAVFLAMGSHESLRMDMEGENAEGVLPSMRFLKAFNLRGEHLARGHVGIVGGGNSAIDAARVAMRQKGVRSVTVFYRRTRREMPAYAEEIGAALEEGVKLQTLVAPLKLCVKDGKLAGMDLQRNKLGDIGPDGRRRPVPVPGSEFHAPLDTLVVAISEKPDVSGLGGAGLNLEKDGRLRADRETLATNRPGVFGGGDLVTGPGTAVDAIATGRRAAVVIRRYLRGEDLKPQPKVRLPKVFVAPPAGGGGSGTARAHPPTLPAQARTRGFAEVEEALPMEDALAEARRCLRCDLQFTRPEDAQEEAAAPGCKCGKST